MASNSKPSVPVTFPRSQGLELAVRETVSDELDRRGGSGGGSDLERRVGNLEAELKLIRESLQSVGKDVSVIGSNYVTKSDLATLGNEIHKTQVDLIKWVVGTLIAGVGVTAAIVFGVMRQFPSQPPTIQVQYPPSQPPLPAQPQASPAPPAKQ